MARWARPDLQPRDPCQDGRVLGLGLALSSSLSWGVADFIGGLQSRRLPVLKVVLITQGVGFTLVVIAILIRGSGPPGFLKLLPAVGGGVAGVAGLSAFYQALSIGTMSIVAPIAATGVAVPVIVGIAGGDRPAAIQVVGIVAATAGVVLASRESETEQPRRHVATRTSVALALVAALGFGTFFVGLRAGARADVLWALFASRGAGVAALVGAAIALRPAGRVEPSDWPLLLAMAVLDLGANVLFAIATRHGLLSIVSVAGSLYPLATVVLARVILGERVRRVQELGIVAAIAGVALIAAG
jgi:drug/metabolite transporter (DMT)-like permease